MTEKALPVHLITGLLGSGKTSCLKHLIQQKPADEQWLVVINEFGDIDIDSAQIENLDADRIQTASIAGGCICCSGQINLQQNLSRLLAQFGQQLTRIFIEPTGLGHPAKIIDTLVKHAWPVPLKLANSVCITSATQLENWSKSKLLQDLAGLADIIVLNKTDLIDNTQRQQALDILANLYPAKAKLLITEFAHIDYHDLLEPFKQPKLKLLHGQEEHQQLSQISPQQHYSLIANTEQCLVQWDSQQQLIAMGWQWSAQNQFNRVALKQFFAEIEDFLIRGKGLIKTGNEWQLIEFSEQQWQWNDIAWRKDSRLQLFFKPQLRHSKPMPEIAQIEQLISACLYKS